MPIKIQELKVIHFEFEKEMYEPNLFEYNMTVDSGVTNYHEDGKVGILIRWKFETSEIGSKTRYGSYISEQTFIIDYPNDDLDELKCDINDVLSQSLNTSRDNLVWRKGNLKDIAVKEFNYPDFPEITHIQYVLSQILRIS
ncbi:hypothetical protein CJD36_002565 [Flavipsychrobacter stenotrophus]|uniref:Uncharacterized protein n=1 Tax=Flavipsychrobacter stenotrophus TaxID=2077091 RepID=A0A2S7T1G0_9BACT|nr:hypothetical protein CJD36_002565 [Flavipsychrobacter stenotrophus]